jgi:serine/threonine protein kinase/Tol biopolymer transport system component
VSTAGRPGLPAGTCVGPYEVLSLLGAGGMGEVYRARDPRLSREVAIKVLPSSSSLDPARLSRFEQEARAAGALNHPNLLAVFDSGRQDGVVYIVFELLEGESLRKRLGEGPLTPAKAVEVATQIAHGLAAAHERGIVHRDLKPDNIFITREGRVKILDFGLAKLRRALDDGAAGSEVETPSEITSPGGVVGTAAYMSPEQVKGQRVDARSDIFSFGCVLYELLSSRRAFAGETAAETMTAILREEPPELASLNGTIPAALRQVVRRCLEKRPEERFHSAHDLGLALEVAASSGSGSGVASAPGGRPRAAQRTLALAVVGLASLALGTWAVRRMLPTESRPVHRAARFTLPLPDGTSLERTSSLAISRDATKVAAVAQKAGVSRLYVRALDGWEWKELPSTEGAWSPFFSPDGGWIGFFVTGRLQRVAVAGGTPQVVCECKAGGTASWGEDGQIVFSAGLVPAVWRVPATGAAPQIVTGGQSAVQAIAYMSPAVLPGGQAMLASTWAAGRARVEVFSLNGGERRSLVDGGHGRYAPTGHVVYSSGTQLLAVPFDPRTLATRGVGIPVVDDLRRPRGPWPSGDFALAENGTLVYAPDEKPQKRLVWTGRDGKPRPIPLPSREYHSPAISPEGDRVAVGIVDGSTRDVWIVDPARGTLSRLTSDADALYPLWSPDGKDLIYTSSRGGAYNLFRKSVGGDEPSERLTNSTNAQKATSWSPDGRLLLLNDVDPVTKADIWVLGLDGGSKPRPVLRTAANERRGLFSPDGRWIAYTSDESGQFEVYRQAWPGLGQKRMISTGGGDVVAWNPNGRELFYVNGAQLLSVAVDPRDPVRIGVPQLLFEGPTVDESRRAGPYDLTRDGKQFLLVENAGDKAVAARLHVVSNFFEELERRVPVR